MQAIGDNVLGTAFSFCVSAVLGAMKNFFILAIDKHCENVIN